MNHRILLWVLTLLTAALTAQAEPITREKARQLAEAFLSERTGSRRLAPVTSQRRLAPVTGQAPAADPTYYVFNRGEQQGFIIVSADDRAEEVLGYCDEGEFDYQALPVNMRTWLDDYARQIEHLRQTQTQAPRRVSTHPRVDQLMTSTWNQGYPYNMNCPNYFGQGTSVTGCVATAMAQIMYYQRSKSTDRTLADIPAYDTPTAHETYGHLHVEGIPEGAPIDWDNMRDNYAGGGTEATRQAVANLMLYCGVAVEMDYTNNSSGAYSYMVAEALRKYFGYGSSVQYVQQYAYGNDGWDELLYNELAHGRPFYLSGSNAEVGHAFVCDGYDGNRYYHINWGWGGQSDGYYLLTNLTPGSQGIGGSDDGYNNGVEAIIGMEPENFTDMAIRFTDQKVASLCTAQWDTNGDGSLSYGEAAQVTSLGQTFRGATTIKTFNELRNFTALTSLDDDAFSGCRSLTTLTLPPALTSIGNRALNGCRALGQLILPESLTHLGDSALCGCRALTELQLPQGLTALPQGALEGCAGLTQLLMPEGLTALGSRAMAGCTKLSSLQLQTADPTAINMGTDVFDGCRLATATLIVLQGGRQPFATTPQWQDFGTIKERRTQPTPTFTTPQTGRRLLIYNTEAAQYVTQGEAWGTQAVTGNEGLRFQLQRDDTMPEGQYYIYSDDTNGGHYLFRTSEDETVGKGVKATFTDGYKDERALWAIQPLGDGLYTIQPPKTSAHYQAGRYWGVQPDHKSNVASPTSGIYYDITYTGHEQACQWAFIDYDQTFGTYQAAQTLGNLLEQAEAKNISCEREQAVFDNMESTLDDILLAQRTLRKKLKYIHFEDELVRDICTANFDLDGNDEISQTEGTMATYLNYYFYGKNIRTFDEMQLFTNLTTLYGNSFEGCTQLRSITLPASLTTMYYRCFYGCAALEEINLPEHISYIGSDNFTGCTALRRVRLANPYPASIHIDPTAFQGLDLASDTLYVPFGTRERYAQADVWKDFGHIIESRAATQPKTTPLLTDTPLYICNQGEHRYLTRGEAWGTQAIVGIRGMRYQLKHNANMPEGQYLLYSAETGKDGKYLFRTDGDSKVGKGTTACFVDGTLTERAYWLINDLGNNQYTIQVPPASPDEEPQYLGVSQDHYSEYTSPTFGAYWDFAYSPDAETIRWTFVTADDHAAATAIDQLAATLKNYIAMGRRHDIDMSPEQAVYDNPLATAQALQDAIDTAKEKLGLINFADTRTKAICLNAYDTDADDELSLAEAAAVSDIGETFRGMASIRSFDELRHFTSLTAIPENAFRNCSGLISICLPESVTAIGKYAFSSCSALKYLALPSTDPLPADHCSTSGLGKSVRLFAPEQTLPGYAADEYWSRFTTVAYTGQPTVTALNDTTTYGKTVTKFSYDVSGAPINGEPAFLCEATATTPVGQYPITPTAGTATNRGLTLVPATLTITPAPLTITAKSYTRLMFEENPIFEATYRSFKNRETAEDLTRQPVFTCDATPDSPAGQYEIRVSGAQSPNYDITYVSGTLTVEAPTAIHTATADGTAAQPRPVYDLQGRKVADHTGALDRLPAGIYIVDGQKVVRR